MARFNSGFDYSADFVAYSRICLEGYLDCMNFNSSTTEIDPRTGVVYTATENYTDPLTGYTYVAAWSDKPTTAITAQILRQAQDYADTVYEPAKS